MDTLFWASFGAITLLLLARFVVPIVAPVSMAARLLTATIKFGDDDADPDRERR
ncbi:hypothetical protein OIU14_15745 [Thalassobacter stenotrophicus]|uniref:hypothetical protein n=1 Tax=Thalassobacter stenotrophicus TaxID=266809 RepID=UPI0022A9C834|nr:hypothetical protein [Thalassobacter stenotrophicus]UYP67899.1 hypothetical protein OIU14_15745 [Thalassobacter stenotrophicus]